MNCPNCGAKSPEGSKFCQSCGTPLPNSTPQVIETNQTNNNQGKKMNFTIFELKDGSITINMDTVTHITCTEDLVTHYLGSYYINIYYINGSRTEIEFKGDKTGRNEFYSLISKDISNNTLKPKYTISKGKSGNSTIKPSINITGKNTEAVPITNTNLKDGSKGSFKITKV